MTSKRLFTRRGTSIAAAALSVALVAPFVSPVAAPQFAAVAAAQDATAPTNPTPAYTDTSRPIYSAVASDSNDTVQGHVRLTYNGDMLDDSINVTEPLAGVTVYAQWIERDGSASPVYYTITDENGEFAIGMRSFIAADGTVRTFDADPALPEGEKWRIWSDNPDTSKYQLLYSYGQEQVMPNGRLVDTAAGAGNGVGPNRVDNVEIRYSRVPGDIWRQNAVSDNVMTTGNLEGGQVSGSLYWNNYVEQGPLSWDLAQIRNGNDYGLPGVDVYASYLSDYAVLQIEANKELFVDESSDWSATDEVRRRGLIRPWTSANEAKLREYILTNVEANRDLWIAETVKATTDANGEWKAQFKGTFGYRAGDPGFDGTDRYDSIFRTTKPLTSGGVTLPANEWLGKVAASPLEGKFGYNGYGTAVNDDFKDAPKHINTEWMMVTTEPLAGIGVMSTFHNDIPTRPGMVGFYGDVHDANVNTVTGNQSVWNIHMAAIPSDLNLDVSPYDSIANFAKPGDTARVDAFGIPRYDNEGDDIPNFYEIVWFDQDGNEIPGTSTGPVKPNPNTTQIEGKPLTVPADITGPTTYQARLYVVNADGSRIAPQPMAVDSFTAIPEDQRTVANWDDTTTDLETPVKLPQTIEGADVSNLTAVLNVPMQTDPETGELVPAEGYNYGTVEIDPETGEITFTPGPDAKVGQRIPIAVRNADGDTIDIPVVEIVEPQDQDNTLFEPEYENKLVVPGTPAESTPSFTDAEGNPVDGVPAEVEKFEIDPDFTAPEGYTVEIDPETGVVTVTADPEALDKDTVEEFDVPVIVTYEDGSTDTADAPFQLDTDGDGTPDVTDEDDDGDGIPDAEEIEDGTNPKDPADASLFEPGYENELVVPGTPATSDPTFTDKDDQPVDGVPAEVEKFEIDPDFTAPEGYTVEIDPETGVVTVTADPEALDKDTVEEFDVPVIVTYEDGSTDTADAPFQLDTDGDGTPDVTDEDDDGDGIPDAEEIEKGTNPKDKDDKPEGPGTPITEDPAWEDTATTPKDEPVVIENTGGDIEPGTTVEVEGPGTATIDPVTGDITVTPGDDAKPGDVIVVEVKDPEGNVIDTIEVTIEADDPQWNDGETTKDEPIVIPADGEVEPGTTVEVTDGPGEATIDDEGNITVTPGDDAKPGDVIVVEVKDPEGNVIDTIEVTITPIADEVEPGYEDVKDDVTSGEPTFTDEETGEPTTKPEGTTFEIPADAEVPEGTTIDPETGVVTIPEKAGETPIVIPVVVTYPDGSKDSTDVTFTNGDLTDADENNPAYGDVVKVPESESRDTKNPFETEPLAEGTEVSDVAITPSEGSDLWDFNVKEGTDGVITGEAPTIDELKDEYNKVNPDGSNKDFNSVVESLKPVTDPTVDVEFTYGDGSKDNAEAGFQVVGKDGKPISDPTGDFDGDGVSNKDEIEKGSNPFDENDKPATEDEPNPDDQNDNEGDGGDTGDNGNDSSIGDGSGSADMGAGSSDADALKRCFADPKYAVKNPLYWLIPAGILTAVPLPEGVQAQLDGAAARINNQVNKLAGDLGLKNMLPRVDIPAELNINTYLTHDQQRQLLGGAMVIAGIAATAAYFNWCLNGTDGGSSTSSISS